MKEKMDEQPFFKKDFSLSKKEKKAAEDVSDTFKKYSKPLLGKLLQLLKLDKIYHRGEGDKIYYYNEKGEEVEVIDFLGGYGASLFGHNHPDLVKTAKDFFDRKMVFNSQASCRKTAALLAKKLNDMLFERVGKRFITTFGNSGTEAVEAGIKHAEFSCIKKIQKIQEKIEEKMIRVKQDLKADKYELDSTFYKIVQDKLGLIKGTRIEKVFSSLLEYNRLLFGQPPLFLSLSGAFHGKTTGSLQLTFNEDYRLPFSRLGPRNQFIDIDDASTIEDAVTEARLKYLDVELKSRCICIVEKEFINIAGFFIEPLQGEGGIQIIPDTFLKKARQVAHQHHFPLIFDEIQSGMGRTGTFLFSQQSGISADYYLLSKSLGGGLAKISALIIEENQFIEEFSMIHTSTFSDDDFSTGIALKALIMLDEDKQMMKNCRERGDFLKNELEKIKSRFQDVIEDVRGQGLMLGIQFKDQLHSSSYAFRVISQHHFLTYTIAGYFLNECNIRVAPTLSHTDTIRLEPSALVSESDCQKLLDALSRACEIIQKHNGFELLKFLVNAPKSDMHSEIEDYRPKKQDKTNDSAPDPDPGRIIKVGFIGHFICADHIALWDKSFEKFSSEQRKTFLEFTYPCVGPQRFDPLLIKSVTGEIVQLNFIGLCVDSETIYKHMINRDIEIIKQKIEEAVDMAIDQGCSLLGFGGFTSIVTRNCKSIARENIGFTTGNSLTVAMGLEAIYEASSDCKIDISAACFAVVGATGNIGSVYCEMIAEKVQKMILVGRKGREDALEKVAGKIYRQALQEIVEYKEGRKKSLQGIAKQIKDCDSVRKILKRGVETFDCDSEYFKILKKDLNEKAPLLITTDMYDLKKAQIILSASNIPNPIIFPGMLSNQPVIINDIAVPADVDPSVKAMGNVTLIKGGIVQVPFEPDGNLPGVPLEKGAFFACFCETLVLGLERILEHFSYGPINKRDVKKVASIAERHGFKLKRAKLEESY